MLLTRTALSILLCALVYCAQAQDIYLDHSSNGSIIYIDEAGFYDSGRDDAPYSNYEDLSTTICSYNGQPLQVEFSKFNLETDKDMLHVSYGTEEFMAAFPGSPFSGEDLEGRILTSSETCMTFRMITDFNVMRSGWEAMISTSEPLSLTKR